MRHYYDTLYNSAREFLDYFLLNPLFRTTNRFHAHTLGRGAMIFRGQSDANWTLLPSAFRSGALRTFTPQPPSDRVDDQQRLIYLGSHLHAEGRSVFIFLEAADRMGLPSPIDYTTTRDSTALARAAFNRDKSYDYGERFPPRSAERATALAQHHGVPTRFLDWTESPLVASYFAAFASSSLSDKPPRPGQEIAVYFLSVWEAGQETSPIEIVSAPRHENSFLRQQQGLFTNQKNANRLFLDTGHWPTVEESAGGAVNVHRARLPASLSDDLLRELYDLGIHRQSLMPSMENAAKAYSYAHALYGEMDRGVFLTPANEEALGLRPSGSQPQVRDPVDFPSITNAPGVASTSNNG